LGRCQCLQRPEVAHPQVVIAIDRHVPGAVDAAHLRN
jgi:hypothetical protein